MKNLFPDLYIDSISDITASMLKKKGMEAVVLDIDNTLVPHNDPNPTEAVNAFLDDMRENGIKLCVVSNNHEERVKPFCERIGIEYYVYEALKPKAYGYRRAAETMKTAPEKICAIGDQIFTDVWGGKRAGCFTVLVKPISFKNEGLLIAIKRILELPILKLIRRRER
jgi:hypothetical protein